jgi:hypothetical protein
MPIIEFDKENKPSVAELRQLLQDAEENYDPVEELLLLERQLAQLEQAHNMTSAEFYGRYKSGEMGDDAKFVAWVGRYRLFIRLKETISSSLKLVLAGSSSFAA